MDADGTHRIEVLCVDDDPDSVSLTAERLERLDAGLSVTTAKSASEALDRIDETGFDCIVSDHDMPGMDGVSFLEAIRAESPTLPFILFTAKGSEEIASRAISAGVTDYVQKGGGPEQFEILARRIGNGVARSRAAELQQHAERILEGSPDAIIVSAEGTIVYANPEAVRLHRAGSADELVGRDILDLVHESYRETVADLLEPIEAGETHVEKAERTLLTLDGQAVRAEVTGRRITWEGRPAIVSIARDRTSPGTSAHEQARYRAAFDEAFDAMVIADDEGRYIEVNRSACELFGVDKADLVGMTIADFAPEGFDVDGAWETFAETGLERGTFPLVRPDGERRTVEYAATANIVPGEHLSVMRDVTEREEHLEELNRQRERLSEFASVVSHDLRNPLTTASGFLELYRDDPDAEYLDRLERALHRIDRIIGDVLYLAREGIDVGETEPVDLAAIVEESWRTVVMEDADASLAVEDDLGTVEADDDRLRQLLENVFRNAVDHGGPGVTVRVEATASGFAVEDDGPGLPDDVGDEVFERGFSTLEDGTGYGLYIVREIANGHGWDVGVTEGVDGGARFEFAVR